MSTTRIAVRGDGRRARIARLEAGRFVGPRPVSVDGTRVRIALVGLCATLLAGDDVRIDIDVGRGVQLDLIEPSGMVAYDAKGARSSWAGTITVAEGSAVTWSCAPFVVAAGADTSRDFDIELGPRAALLMRETLVLGRSREVGGALRSRLRADHEGRPLLHEDLDLRDAAARAAPGILGDNRVLGTVALLGVTPPSLAGTHETTLAGPGGLARALAVEAHHTQDRLDDTWWRWHRVVAEASTGGAQEEPGPVTAPAA